MKYSSRFDTTQYIRIGAAFATLLVASIVFIWSPDKLQYPAPLRLIRLSEVVDALSLALLFYSSIGLLIGRRIAWLVALYILGFSAIWESIQSVQIISPFSFLIAFVFILVALTRRYYPREHQVSSFQPALERALFFTFITTAVGCICAFFVASLGHRHFSLISSSLISLDHMYVLDNIFSPIPNTPKLIDISMRLVLFSLGVINYIAIAASMLRPLIDQFVPSRSAEQRVASLLDTYGSSSDDYFKYFPHDKSYFFSHQVDGFVAYGVSNGVCAALADPIAKDAADQAIVLKEFLFYVEQHGWQICFLSVPEKSLPLYTELNLTQVKLGSAAIVDTHDFVATTSNNKHFRYIQNRFTKEGYTTKLSQPPHSRELIASLRTISDEWLSRDNRKERQFAMGYFDEAYLKESQLFVVYDSEGNPQAFTNLPPTYSNERISFDLLRYGDEAPRDVNAFLFARLIAHLEAEGYPEFNMGLAPLADLEQSRKLDERSLHLLFKYTNRWFAFKGLHTFKSKFNPSWEAQYALYQGHRLRTLNFAVELNRLMKYTEAKGSAKN